MFDPGPISLEDVMLKHFLTWTVLACVVGAPSSSAASGAERFTTLQWNLGLDAQGHVTTLSAKGDAIEAVRARLEQVIPQWEFVSGMLDGKPVATDTLLSVRVALTPSADGSTYAVKLVDVRTGGSVGDTKKSSPRFPPSELRRMVERKITSAQIAIEVGYDASGKATELRVVESSLSQPEGLVKAVMKSLSEWTYVPERVAGVGVPGTLVVPVCFTLAQSAAESRRLSNACRWTLPGSDATIEEGQSLALDSRVRLKTDVSGSVL
jgi:hypothetical protein